MWCNCSKTKLLRYEDEDFYIYLVFYHNILKGYGSRKNLGLIDFRLLTCKIASSVLPLETSMPTNNL